MHSKRLYGFLLLFIAALVACSGPHEFAGAAAVEPQLAPDFVLQSADGPVQLSDYDGQYVFIYFGYTFCPDICPATLAELARARRLLEDDADQVQVLMITVDPERDTPAQLAEYVSRFDPTFVGLSGDEAAINAIGKPYGLFYQRHEGSAATGYLIDHTARAFLLDPQRQVRVAYPYDAAAEDIVADLRYLFRSGS